MADDDTSDTDTNDDPPDTGTDWEAEAKKWKRYARRHETQANELRAKLEELESDGGSANKSDMDKLRGQIADLGKDLAEERRKNLVAEVASKYELTPAQAKRLSGTTREELEEDADDLVESFKPAKGKPAKGDDDSDDDSDSSDADGKASTNGNDAGSGRSKPKEKLRGGASSESADDMSGEEMADVVWKRSHGGI
jgi:polyhydroxyalkanoate synthesis regulator phasin